MAVPHTKWDVRSNSQILVGGKSFFKFPEVLRLLEEWLKEAVH